MKRSIIATILLTTATLSVHAEDKVTVYFDTVTPKVEGNSIIFDGLRVDGFGFSSTKDAVRAEFVFDPVALNFAIDPKKIVTYKDIGIFHEHNMSIDVEPVNPAFTVSGYNFDSASADPFEFTTSVQTPVVATMDLKPGHVMAWYVNGASLDYEYEFTGPNTSFKGTGKRKDNQVCPAVKIFSAGTYSLKIVPTIADKSMTFKLKVDNANARKLASLPQDGKILELLEKSSADYAKYLITLNSGDTLEVPGSSDAEVVTKLVNEKSQLIASGGLDNAISYQETATKAQNYYLFIYNKAGAGKRYGATIKVVPKPEETPPTEEATTTPSTDKPEPTIGGDTSPATPSDGGDFVSEGTTN